MRLTLGVILCDNVAPGVAAAAGGGYREMFQRLFENHSPEAFAVELRFYDAIRGEYPEMLTECDGYLTSGSAVSVNDGDPWIVGFEAFIRRLHEEEVKLFAICFGHQMIAMALGGRVGVAVQGWGVGVHRVNIEKGAPWMLPAAESYAVISSHQEQVTELPEAAEILASSPHCPVAMLRCGSLIGIQGHPEFHAAYANALLDSRKSIIPEGTRASARTSLDQKADQSLLVSWILHFMETERPGWEAHS